MTYVQYINCSKWKKVIGISLWIGATIGLGYGLYALTSFAIFPGFIQCNEQFDDKIMGFVCKPEYDYRIAGFLFIFAIGSNGSNAFMIWNTLNNHYKWLEIRCGIKPNPNEVKHE